MSRKLSSMNGFSNNNILSLTIPWPEEYLIDFLRRFVNLPTIYFERENAAVSLAGAGIVARVEANGESRFADIREKASQLFSRIKLIPEGENTSIPRLIGGFSFCPSNTGEKPWSDFPAATFVLPAYMLTKVDGKLWLTLNRALPVGADRHQFVAKMYVDIENLRIDRERINRNLFSLEPDNEINDLPSKEIWEDMVSNAVERIKQGELEKVVLTRICRVKSEQHIDLFRSLDILASTYPGCSRFWFEFNPGHAFFGATPERLVMVQGREVNTVALAGSIGRGKTREEDQQLSNVLLNSIKERHEHRLVVEDLKSRLQSFASELDIADQPDISYLINIQHLKTNISGTLKNGSSILDVVEGLHPTAALGGFPREGALQLIKELERQERGWFGAPIGWFDSNGDGEFVVAIRSGVVLGKEAWLYSGAGIVADSLPANEWKETQMKLKPMLVALGGK